MRELSALLSTPDPMDHQDLLRRHVAGWEQRIARARVAKDLIEHAFACPHRFADCEHARDQIAARIPPAPHSGHGGGNGKWPEAESQRRSAELARPAGLMSGDEEHPLTRRSLTE
ncbi:hypothetical protein AB0F17_33535 [Nonomuraea sp. NPDC026600]|uniref:hypothetical protein n=1 Tax=Nonomuraea sp. NPDC026600 TaxID=3155363 RepID=UPI0033E36C6A